MGLKDPTKRREYARQYYQKNKDKMVKASKEYRENNKEKVKASRKVTSKKYRVEKEYGISIEEYYDAMTTSNVCEKCGTTEKLCYDHDHTTMEFRGVLCSSCNAGIGLLGDTIKGVREALEYLEGRVKNENKK